MVKELAGRLAAVDPEALAAVRVIAYFDRLGEARAGLEAIVRGAAVLAGCPARLVDEARHVHVRVCPDGRREDRGDPCDPDWPYAPVSADGLAGLWLERVGVEGPAVAMVLERGAATAGAALDRTRGRAPVSDPALVELLLDGSAPTAVRLRAARSFGLRERVRAVALGDGSGQVSTMQVGELEGRAGVGPAVPPAELPASWAAARTALRFAAEGTALDPGPRVVYAETLGGLAVLADAVRPGSPAAPDVETLERTGAAAPWMLGTLYAVAYAPSLRMAAIELSVHHSTLQDRLTQAEHLLGWTMRNPTGRLRLQLAFALRRLHRCP